MNLYRETFSHIKSFPTVFWMVILATFINQAGNMAFVFLVVYATQHLGLSVVQGSFAFASFSVSMLVSGILIGSVIDRIGAARIMISALFANATMLITFPLFHQYHQLLLICILWGLCFGAYRPASQTLMTHLSTPGLHKVTFSVYRLVLNLGMSIGPAIAGHIAAYSFPAIFIGNGVANILASCILIFGLSGSTWLTFHAPSEHKKILSIYWLKHDSVLRLFVIAMIPVSMVFFQHETTLSVYLKQTLHLSLSFYGWLFTINTLMIVFLELLLNVATINWPYRMNFMLGSFFITAGSFGIFFATNGLHIILLTMVWTVGEMILYPSASSYIADIAPVEHRGSYMGMYTTCSNLGMLLGPAGGAVVMQYFGGHALWLACGLTGMLSVVLFGALKQPNKS